MKLAVNKFRQKLKHLLQFKGASSRSDHRHISSDFGLSR